MASISDPNHAKLECDIKQYCENMGARCFAIPYHDTVAEPIKELLKVNDSFTSILVRTRSDQHSIFPNDLVLKWDAKTCGKLTGDTFFIEAMPFMAACVEAAFMESNYLFCCRRLDGKEYGIVAGLASTKLIGGFLIPHWRWGHGDEWRRLFSRFMKSFRIDVAIDSVNCNGNASGDPFVKLRVDQCEESIPDWKSVIQGMVK